ncbi:hypothetical protein [Xenorhabdus cabanillasii]|uniref:hypothetical protein n=1 Tax=Xenorhabdus cabanillasii TaxID=351673 RepID=UPI001474FD78|nr:hypothetical protein [Xenorhabdus cabanillasii]
MYHQHTGKVILASVLVIARFVYSMTIQAGEAYASPDVDAGTENPCLNRRHIGDN